MKGGGGARTWTGSVVPQGGTWRAIGRLLSARARGANEKNRPELLTPDPVGPTFSAPNVRVDVEHHRRGLVDRALDDIAAGIVRDAYQPDVRRATLQVLRESGVEPYDTRGQMEALFRAVRDGMYYLPDPWPVEYLQGSSFTLKAGGGDCDCLVRLLAAMQLSAGNPVRLVVTTHEGDPDPDEPTHVWLEVAGPEGWVAMDPTRPELEAGDRPPGIVGMWTGEEIGSSMSRSQGLGKGRRKVVICHIPPGNPDNAHTIEVGEAAVRAHLDHGDYIGPCRETHCPPWAFTPGSSPPDDVVPPFDHIRWHDLEVADMWRTADYWTRRMFIHPERGVVDNYRDRNLLMPTPADLQRWGVYPGTHLRPHDVWSTYAQFAWVGEEGTPLPYRHRGGRFWAIISAIDVFLDFPEAWRSRWAGYSTLLTTGDGGQCSPFYNMPSHPDTRQCIRPPSPCEQYWVRLSAQEAFPDFIYQGPGYLDDVLEFEYFKRGDTSLEANPEGLTNAEYIIPPPPNFGLWLEALDGVDISHGLSGAGVGFLDDLIDDIVDVVDEAVDWIGDVGEEVWDNQRDLVRLAAETAPIWSQFVPGGQAWGMAAQLANRALNGDAQAEAQLAEMGISPQQLLANLPTEQEINRIMTDYQQDTARRAGGSGSGSAVVVAGGLVAAGAAALAVHQGWLKF